MRRKRSPRESVRGRVPEAPARRVQVGAAGALAGVSGLAAGEIATALLPGARSQLSGAVRGVIDATPGPMVDVGVAVVGENDKPLLALGGVSLTASLSAAAAILSGHWPRRAAALAVAAPAVGTWYAARLPGADRRGTVAAGAAAAVTTLTLASRARRRNLDTLRSPAAVAVVASVGAAAAIRRRGRADEDARTRVDVSARAARLPAPDRSTAPTVAGLAPLLTPVDDFYKIDVTFPAPHVDIRTWRLRVHGTVSRTAELSFEELLDLGAREVDALLVCVHNPVGGHRMGNGRWIAVAVRELLIQAGLDDDLVDAPQQGEVVARSIDGYAVTLPLDAVLDGALIAVGLDGRPLPFRNGFPARLLLPGFYGYAANVKWLTELEVRARTGAASTDYWSVRGWPASGGRVAASSRIDVPRPASRLAPGEVVVAGYAWAPPEGVDGVDVAVDDGPWQPAELAAELSPLSWRAWTYCWTADPGPHRLRVRCRGQAGDQEEMDAAPYPHGSRGLHAITVEVDPTARGPLSQAVAVFGHVARSRLQLAAASACAWRSASARRQRPVRSGGDL